MTAPGCSAACYAASRSARLGKKIGSLRSGPKRPNGGIRRWTAARNPEFRPKRVFSDYAQLSDERGSIPSAPRLPAFPNPSFIREPDSKALGALFLGGGGRGR